jgi:uncharacterized protein (DUF885 family)
MRNCQALCVVLFLILSNAVRAQDTGMSEMRDYILQYQADYGTLNRKYTIKESDEYITRFSQLYADWLKKLKELPFESMSQQGKVDYILLRTSIEEEESGIQRDKKELQEIAGALKFTGKLLPVIQERRRGKLLDPEKTAATLNTVKNEIKANQQELEKLPKYSEKQSIKATEAVQSYRKAISEAVKFYNEYDPLFSWWVAAPQTELDSALSKYTKFLKNWKTADPLRNDGSGIVGNPIGREELIKSLSFEMIPYTPEELIEIGNKEFAWCEKEMLKASNEMGFGNNWKAALEKVKDDHVEAGRQPQLVDFLAEEAITFLEQNDLVTVPDLAKESWRMTMMTPEGQRFAPFFLGGEVVQIAFPTSTMQHDEKMMSIRGNNKHFSRATVFHELIPGHHLQQFMNQRYNPHRQLFRSPFWTEGWALYWEMILWEKNFQKSPENRVGMLFWRMHRCARIVFSLNYHLGKWTPQQCIDFLVDKVGHERANASAEVRRSFTGGYGPLYQLAYMMGAKQFYALRDELVTIGKMKEKEYHDAVLKNNAMPVEMVRSLLINQPLTRDFKTSWKFKY